jgi:hypothetical protein
MENQILQNQDDFTLPEVPGIENFDMAEWVFQFDDDEPVVVAWSNSEEDPGDLSFILKPNSGSNVFFQSSCGKKTLKLFSRRMSDERRKELKELKDKEKEIIQKLNNSTPEGEN